jgi:oligopeptide/dipeptide ABC transporter ATP-binding protein
MNILEIKNLKQYFYAGREGVFGKKQYVKAVDGISFKVDEGECLGLVGESGCGKSTLGRTVLKLIEPSAGEIYYKNTDITDFKKKEMKGLRRNMQMIFQDPYASLNPRMSIKGIIDEPLKVHNIYNTKKEMNERVDYLLNVVGLSKNYKNRFPGEFSGGQRQRIMIARILATNPELVIADEAVSALDVSIQSQILNLLSELQEEFSLTYIFISHDLGVVKFISDKIAVMYLGKIVEYCETNELYNNPGHPYTKSLLSSIPSIKTRGRARNDLKGEIPSPMNPPKGCRFHTRCKYVMDICREKEPENTEVSENHFVSCHLVR